MIHVTGKTDEKGRLTMVGEFMLENYLAQYPSTDFIIKLEPMPKKPSLKSVYYYQHGILPQLQNGFKNLGQYLTKQQIDQRLRSQFVGTLEEQILDNKFVKQVKPVEQLDKQTFMHFLDFVRRYAADNLKVQLQDYRTL